MSAASSALGALLLLAASCGGSPTAPRTVRLDGEFTLAPGQTAQVEGIGLRVTFERVGADSRCPADATCVWEGDAVVVVSVREGSAGASSRELHTSGRFPSQAEVGNHHVRLVSLAPVRRQGAAPAPGDYRATLLVSRSN